MKLKHIEHYLQQLNYKFENPKIDLEQYHTPPHLAATILYTIQNDYNDLEGKVVLDLGCGSGILSFGSILLGADFCYGIDCDEDILKIYNDNKYEFEISNCDCFLYKINDISDLKISAKIFKNKIDTILMNPPFGTRNSGIDLTFIKFASYLNSNVIYSLNKTITRENIIKKIKLFENVRQVDVIAQLRYDLDHSYKFHKKKSHDIDVDLIRIEIGDKED